MDSRGKVDRVVDMAIIRGITRVRRIRGTINLLHRSSSRINSNTVKVSLLLLLHRDNPVISLVRLLGPVHPTRAATIQVHNKDTIRVTTIKITIKAIIKVTAVAAVDTVLIPSVKSAVFSPPHSRPLFRENTLDRMAVDLMAVGNPVNMVVELRE